MLSQPAKRSGATMLHVNDVHSLAPHTCSDAAMKIYASLSYKSENYLFEGYEILGGKVKAPHSGGWSTNLESMVTSSTRKLTEKDASRVRTPQSTYGSSTLGYMECYIKYSRLRGWGSSQSKAQGPTWHLGQDPKCPEVFKESNKHETPSRLVCLLQWVLLVSSRRHSLECPVPLDPYSHSKAHVSWSVIEQLG
ncbi:hypothetical protein EDD17DRAFT_1509704 [Pisolithus thermaeus]|nr:hypothetical protein EDD17DRAFT_1509704 [Pisolithus thermaeus]